ncbi:IS66 family transposase [Rhizobium sp. 814_E9_N1_1]|uniref:IS66 family transposase n=1 Tax=unclassified Rhizobium TaxID=2613769 RepID=UPI003F2795D0
MRGQSSYRLASCRFLDDGSIEIDNNAAERAIRPIATTNSYYTSLNDHRAIGGVFPRRIGVGTRAVRNPALRTNGR